jgi:hypothetical protein
MNEGDPNQFVAEAADSLRTFNHQTRVEQLPDGCMTAPDAYSILGGGRRARLLAAAGPHPTH